MHFLAQSAVRCGAVWCGEVKCTHHACSFGADDMQISVYAGFFRARGCRASGQGSRRVAEAAVAAWRIPMGAHLARCRGWRRCRLTENGLNSLIEFWSEMYIYRYIVVFRKSTGRSTRGIDFARPPVSFRFIFTLLLTEPNERSRRELSRALRVTS